MRSWSPADRARTVPLRALVLVGLLSLTLLPTTLSAAPASQTASPGTVLFLDDFDAGDGPMPRDSSETVTQSYVDGTYQIDGVSAKPGVVKAAIPGVYADSQLDVDVNLFPPANAGRSVTLGCLASDAESADGPRFNVFPYDGYATLSLQRGAGTQLLVRRGGLPLNPDSDWQHLQLTCQGDRARGSVNGVEVVSSPIVRRDPGVSWIEVDALSDDDPVSAQFDNLSIAQLAALPKPTPIPTPGPGSVVRGDNFDDPSRGLLTTKSNDTFTFTYEAGEYVIRKIKASKGFNYSPVGKGTDYASATVAVDVRVVADTADNYVGVTCRVQQASASAYWAFLKPADRSFQIVLSKDGTSSKLLAGTASSLQPGDARNHVELTCGNSWIVLKVNGQQVAAVQNGDLQGGYFGIAGTSFRDKSETRFDNLTVTLESPSYAPQGGATPAGAAGSTSKNEWNKYGYRILADPEFFPAFELVHKQGYDWVLAALNHKTTSVLFLKLPDTVYGAFAPEQNVVMVQEWLRNAPTEDLAAMLVHEATHVSDDVNGALSGTACLESEVKARKHEADFWRGLYGLHGKGGSANALEDDLNAEVRYLSDYSNEYGDAVRDAYQDSCRR